MFMQKLFRFIGIGILGVIMCLLYSPFLFAGRGERNMSARIITSSVVTGEELDLLSRTGWIGENRNLIDFDPSYKTSNLRDSLNMEFVGRGLYGPPSSVFVRDTLAFVGATAAMMIFDISNPLEPFLLGHIPIHLGQGWDIYVVDDYAYVSQWGGWADGGIQIVDISDPTAPYEVGYHEAGDWVLDIYATSDYAYACDGTGLSILDVSDPANPSEVSFVDFGEYNWTQEVVVVGNYAYVGAMGAGLKIVDVSNPAQPNVVGTFLSGGDISRGVRVRGNYAYLIFDAWPQYSLVIVDISDPAEPLFVGSCDASGTWPYISGDYVYVNKPMMMMYPGGLQIIDISDPENPFEAGYCNIMGSPREVDGDTSFAYSVGDYGEMVVVDVSDATAPEPVADYNIGYAAYSVEVVNSYAYVADYNWPMWFSYGIHRGILRILDISDPANPIDVGSLETGGECRDVSIQLPYAYIADEYGGMRIVDVSQPDNPWEVGHYDATGFDTKGIDVVGDYAYVCSAADSLFILDISDPTNPFVTSTLSVTYPRRVFINGNYAYLTSTSGSNPGMYIIDVSNPAEPFEVGSCGSNGEYGTWDVYVVGDIAYIADSDGGLLIMDVSDPSDPVERSNLTTRGLAASIYVSGDYAYVGTGFIDGIPGVEVINISDTYNPTIVGYYDLDNFGYDVYVEGDFIYVANGQCGFYILRYTGGSSIDDEYSETSLSILSQNYPNPFNPTTTISYKLEKPGKIILNIYNLQGQLVKKFVDSRRTVGKYSLVWDGKDEGGKKLSSGIYFYQIETPNFKSQINKMVLIR